MRKTARALLIASGFSIAAACAGAAEHSAGPVIESAEVTRVEVPVNVIGRDGKPVRGLTAADFELRDDGRPQKILSLDVVDLARKRGVPGLPGNLPGAARRHFLLLFDFSFASPNEIARSRQAALRFVTSAMQPDDLAAVGIASVEKGTRLLLNFTSDRGQLAAAIRTLGVSSPLDQARDPLAFAFVNPGDPFIAKIVPAEELRSSDPGEIAAENKVLGLLAQKTSDTYMEARIGRQLGGMTELAKALDAVEGRKTIIYFSEGFDARLMLGKMMLPSEDLLADNESLYMGDIWSVDVDRRYANAPLQRSLADMTKLFRRSDCTVYPIDVAGLQDETDATSTPTGRGEDSLFSIAAGTGGELLRNSNDIAAQMEKILERTSVTYILSFEPHCPKPRNAFHELRVKVDVPHSRVSARAGYYGDRDFRQASPLERMLAAADALTSGRSPGDLPISALALPLAGGAISRVPVLVHLSPAAFSREPASGREVLGIYVYAYDDQGRLADYFTRMMTLDLARQKTALDAGGLSYLGLCRLLPGRYRVRILVRDEQSGAYGFQAVNVAVPDYSQKAFAALPPVFIRGAQGGLNVRDSSGSDFFSVGGTDYIPEADPGFASGSHARLCVMVYETAAGGKLQPFQMDAEVVESQGTRLPAKVRLLGRSAPTPEGLVTLLLDFDVAGLPAGQYSLSLTFRGAPSLPQPVSTLASFRIL